MDLACGLALMTGVLAAGVEKPPRTLPADWCTTPDQTQASSESGGCPLQGACDDPAVRDAYLPEASTPFKTIRVHVVVFREDDGSNPAATEQEVIDQMARLVDDFAPYRIRFVYTWEYVDNTLFRYGGDDTLMKLTHAVSPETTCNVFVTDQNGGYAVPPWFRSALTAEAGIVIGDIYFEGDTSVLSHEMGHVIGLWHTQQWAVGVECSHPCSAWASGINGDTTGDFCSDTPPTPTDWDCEYPTGIDACSGVPWAPTLPESFMSYGLPCWSIFTDQQASRMHCWFEAVLTGYLVTCPGDANSDGEVGIQDLLGLLAAWGSADPAYDLVADGNVGIEDFLAMLALWGPCE